VKISAGPCPPFEEEVMRKLLALVIVVLALPVSALAADWQNVSMVDSSCLSKVKADPDKHPTSCALKCADSGYLIKTADGWVKLDDAGNKLAIAELKNTKKKDHVRVNVSGEKKGDVIAVSSLKMAD
jgi:hypothetical protein